MTTDRAPDNRVKKFVGTKYDLGGDLIRFRNDPHLSDEEKLDALEKVLENVDEMVETLRDNLGMNC